jgi:hypothetical protein
MFPEKALYGQSLEGLEHADNRKTQLLELVPKRATPDSGKITGKPSRWYDPWVLDGDLHASLIFNSRSARNRGKVDYRAENDHRHFLYRGATGVDRKGHHGFRDGKRERHSFITGSLASRCFPDFAETLQIWMRRLEKAIMVLSTESLFSRRRTSTKGR